MKTVKAVKAFFPLIILIYTALSATLFLNGDSIDTEQLYLDGRFADILSFFKANEKRGDFQALTLTQKLLYIECLARTNKGQLAQEKLQPLLQTHPSDPEVLATSAVIHLSMGRLEQADGLLKEALNKSPDSPRALLSKIMLQLYRREFHRASKTYKALHSLNPKWAQSDLLFIVGLDLYRIMGNGAQLARMYKTHTSGTGYKAQNRKENLKLDAKLYKRTAKQPLFSIQTGSDTASIPFDPDNKNIRVNTITMTVKGVEYKVLLDTGNATGWMVHNRNLRDSLKPRKGGRTVSRIGSQAGMLTGYRQWYKKLDFNGFSLLNVDGVYVPKPHPSFPDANLNPLFIRDRVITFDFINKKLVLHTFAAFQKILEGIPAQTKPVNKPVELPWYGYKHAMVPVKVKNQPGLAMLETGAEDIALKLEFAKHLAMPLQARKKFLGNGSVLQYHLTPLTLQIKHFLIKRSNAEVWSFHRFYHPITGLTPDVIIGPHAMTNALIISFHPQQRSIYLSPPAGTTRRVDPINSSYSQKLLIGLAAAPCPMSCTMPPKSFYRVRQPAGAGVRHRCHL